MKLLKDMNEPELREFCRGIARDLEEKLPPGPSARGKCAFFLAFTDDLGPGVGQYVSNIERLGAIEFLRETADRLEGREDVTR